MTIAGTTEDTVTINYTNLKQITITRAEIVSIEELPDRSLRIRTTEKQKSVIIPVYLDGYQEVKAFLNNWSSITYSNRSPHITLWKIIGSLLGLTAMAIIFNSHDKHLVLISGSFIIIMMVWAFIVIQCNKFYDKKFKRKSWYILLGLVFVVAKILIVLIK